MNYPQKYKEIYEMAQKPLRDEKKKKVVEIIMLKYKEPEVETEAVRRIVAYTNWPFKLTVYDNRLNEGRSNISKIWNKLIRQSTCDYVLILDSDAYVNQYEPCWLTRMMETFEKDKECDIVLPRVTRTSSPEQRFDSEKEYPSEPREMRGIFAAQCVLYKKEVFEKVGWFNEDYYLYGQDSEWSLKAMNHPEVGLSVRDDVLLDHMGSYSIDKTARRKEFNKNLEREYAGYLFEQEHKKYQAFDNLYFKGVE